MKALSAAIIEVIIEDGGNEEVLKRLSDPYWFQALTRVNDMKMLSMVLFTASKQNRIQSIMGKKEVDGP